MATHHKQRGNVVVKTFDFNFLYIFSDLIGNECFVLRTLIKQQRPYNVSPIVESTMWNDYIKRYFLIELSFSTNETKRMERIQNNSETTHKRAFFFFLNFG